MINVNLQQKKKYDCKYQLHMIYFSLCQAVINRGIPGMPKIPIIKVDSGPSGYFDPCWINLSQKLILQPVQINKTAQPVYTLHALCSLNSDDLRLPEKMVHFTF